MRVTLLCHVFPRAADDPLGAFLLHLSQALAQLEVNGERLSVHVVAPHAPGLATVENFDGVDVTRFRYAPAPYETLAYTGVMHERVARGISGKILFSLFTLSFFLSARSVTRRTRAQVIHAHWWLPGGIVGALVSKLTGVSLVITTHGTDVEQLRRARWSVPLARFAFRQARAITCGSTYLRDQLVALNVAASDRVRVIPMPVNPLFGKAKRDEGRTGEDEGRTTNDESGEFNPRRPIEPSNHPVFSHQSLALSLLTVSRLTAQKSLDTLLDAVALLRARGIDATLCVVGDGERRGALEEQATRLKIKDRVEFVGMLPQAELPRYYSACDVFVLPSVREGMGLVLAEALLCGAPVVATNSGGIPDLVRDGETGLLFPERDAPALADALEKLARDPTLAARLAENGKRWVEEHYAPERVAGDFVEVYLGCY